MFSVDVIETAARSCIGTKWTHQGRIPGKGLDCIGLVRWPLVAAGVSTIDYTRYGLAPNPARMGELLRHYFEPAPMPPQPGDILWFVMNGEPMHVGILTSSNTVIHAVQGGPGVVVEHAFRAPWPGRVTKVFRYKSLEGVEAPEWQL